MIVKGRSKRVCRRPVRHITNSAAVLAIALNAVTPPMLAGKPDLSHERCKRLCQTSKDLCVVLPLCWC